MDDLTARQLMLLVESIRKRYDDVLKPADKRRIDVLLGRAKPARRPRTRHRVPLVGEMMDWREQRVRELSAEGMTAEQIAVELNVTERTVWRDKKRLREKKGG